MNKYALAVSLALLCGHAVAADSVMLAGVLGSKALLIVNGAPPRALGSGESQGGVKVISVGRDEAVIESDGRRLTLRLGDSPASVGARPSAGGRRIVLTADSSGHFVQQGTINGKIMQFLVDTGATAVAIGMPMADRMGLNYKAGQPVRLGTANGTVMGWRIKLDNVRVQDVDVYGVDAVVTPQDMPYVLLGNSFLTQFQMSRVNDQMVLEKRY
jgi:aspartyl protease family protein